MVDELRRPLRRRRLADHLRLLRPSALAAASFTLAAAAAGLGLWLATASDEFDGGPVVRVSIARPDPQITGTASVPSRPTDPAASASRGTPSSPFGRTAEETDTASGLSPPPSEDDIAADKALADRGSADRAEAAPSGLTLPRARPLPPAPVAAVSEAGEFGPLPRIASDGRTPFEVYARSVPDSVLISGRPKVAVVLGGMGLSAKLTRQAMRGLPDAVTLAFAPYGESVQALANEARRNGHEIMLQLPMEPFGYPAVDPGPRTLRAGDAAKDNSDNLGWLMSRFAGYAGVVNYMGARLSGDEAALHPLLAELSRRGLIYLDDGSSARSLAQRIGRELDLPVRRAQFIDGASYDEIREHLNDLEEAANVSGFAIGSGTGLPITIDAVQSWARDLEARGIDLVPASVIFKSTEHPRRAAAHGEN